MRFLGALWLALAMLGSAAAQAPAPPAAAAFAAQPSLTSTDLSPGGQWVAGIKLVAGGEALIVADWRTGKAVAIQSARYEAGLEIDWVAWKTDDRLIFGVRQWCDRRGEPITLAQARANPDRAFRMVRVFAINRDGTRTTQLLMGEMNRLAFGASTYLVDDLPRDPVHILLGSFSDDAELVFRVDATTGAAQMVTSYPGARTSGWMTDGEGVPVMRSEVLARNSGYRVYRRRNGSLDWIKVIEVRSAPDSIVPDFQFVASGPGANQVYVIARPPERDTAAIFRFDTATGALGEALAADPKADFVDAIVHPRTNELLLSCVDDRRRRCSSTDPAVAADWAYLATQLGEAAVPRVTGVSADANVWLVHGESPQRPGAYYIFDRAARRVQRFVDVHPALAGAAFAPTRTIDYVARDGAPLWAYYTALAGGGKRPLIVMPHGGPEARDEYGFDAWVQFLAARGYAVLQPNFRGGSGFGRAFAVAGHRQWGRRMQEDVSDAVRHMIAAGEVDATRMCIVGASYGGYAALAAAVLEPDLYKCAIGINGVYDLPEMLAAERREEGRGSQAYAYWVGSIGDPQADAAALIAASPARRAAEIKAPVLLVGGVEDQVVAFDQSVRMERALRDAGRNVTLSRYESEGHSPYGWERSNYTKFLTELGAFVDRHIGAPAP